MFTINCTHQQWKHKMYVKISKTLDDKMFTYIAVRVCKTPFAERKSQQGISFNVFPQIIKSWIHKCIIHATVYIVID